MSPVMIQALGLALAWSGPLRWRECEETVVSRVLVHALEKSWHGEKFRIFGRTAAGWASRTGEQNERSSGGGRRSGSDSAIESAVVERRKSPSTQRLLFSLLPRSSQKDVTDQRTHSSSLSPQNLRRLLLRLHLPILQARPRRPSSQACPIFVGRSLLGGSDPPPQKGHSRKASPIWSRTTSNRSRTRQTRGDEGSAS